MATGRIMRLFFCSHFLIKRRVCGGGGWLAGWSTHSRGRERARAAKRERTWRGRSANVRTLAVCVTTMAARSVAADGRTHRARSLAARRRARIFSGDCRRASSGVRSADRRAPFSLRARGCRPSPPSFAPPIAVVVVSAAAAARRRAHRAACSGDIDGQPSARTAAAAACGVDVNESADGVGCAHRRTTHIVVAWHWSRAELTKRAERTPSATRAAVAAAAAAAAAAATAVGAAIVRARLFACCHRRRFAVVSPRLHARRPARRRRSAATSAFLPSALMATGARRVA